MVQEILAPGVKNAEEADLGAEMFLRPGYGEKGLGTHAEQQIIERRLVLQCQIGDGFRQGEDNMEVLHGQQFGTTPVQPAGALERAALGTVAIAAGVVAVAFPLAVVAFFDVATEGGGTAEFNVFHQAKLIVRQVILLPVGRPVGAKNVSQLQRWPDHYRLCFLGRPLLRGGG